MFLLLKLILIVLINKANAYITYDSEVILLPAWNLTGVKQIPLSLKVFGKLIQMNLHRNDQIVPPVFEVRKYNAKSVTEKLSQLEASGSCLFIHEDHVNSAVINFCKEHGLKGLVFLENDILEIWPTRNVFAPLSFINDVCFKEQINQSFGQPHLIKKLIQYYDDSNFYLLDNFKRKPRYTQDITEEKFIIKLAIFVDSKLNHWLMRFTDIGKTRSMMLLYVKNIQNFFHHPSLGVRIDISLVKLIIMETEPFPIFDDGAALLKSFCNYTKIINPPNDYDLRHWDIGLYVTQTNIFTWSNGTKNYLAVGVSFSDGACNEDGSCAIAEFPFDDIDPSIRKSSVCAAHEIGHLLGLSHDEEKKDNYIMLPGPKPFSELKWSMYSHNTIKSSLKRKLCLRKIREIRIDDDVYDDYWWTSDIFDNPLYYDLPGREWTAKAQCELFLRGEDANVVTLHDICQNLQCETPHKNKSYFTARALIGTHCALGKECRGGECVPIIEPPYIFKFCEMDNWSEWKEDFCKSSCLEKSKGVLAKRRFCKQRIRKTAKCVGPYYDMVLCDDSLLCSNKRKTIDEFATKKCLEFSKLTTEANLSIIKPGKQYSYDVEKPWVACTIYCGQRESSDYYAPRLEMLNYRVDPYFPDGTWCHKQDGLNYYCRQHYCLPENYS